MPKPVAITPAQELAQHQRQQLLWGEKHGHYPAGTANKPKPMPTPVTRRPIVAPATTAKERVLGSRPAALLIRNTAPPAKTVPAPVRAPVAPPKTPSISAELAAKLVELETARAKKNAWARDFEKLEDEVKALFEAESFDTYSAVVESKDENDQPRKTNLTLSKQTGGTVQVETLDKELLKTLVTPEIYEQCTVIQKGLVKEHAGEAILTRITLLETKDLGLSTVVHIKSSKIKSMRK